MDCKLVRQAYIGDDASPKIDEAELRDHILHCPDCEAYFDAMLEDPDDQAIEGELHQLFEKVPVPMTLMKRVRRKRVMTMRQIFSVAILCALVLLPFAYGVVASLPQFSRANETYYKYGSVQAAEKAGQPIQEVYFEAGKYRLFVKDIVVNSEMVSMMATVLDNEDQTPDGLEFNIRFAGDNPKYRRIFHTMDSSLEAWARIVLERDDIPNNSKKCRINIEAKNNSGAIIIKHDFDINFAHLTNDHQLTRTLSNDYNFEGLKIKLELLEVNGTFCKIAYTTVSETFTRGVHLDIALKDDMGNSHYANIIKDTYKPSGKGDGYQTYVEECFESVNFEDFCNGLTFVVNGVNYLPLSYVGTQDALPSEFTYKGNVFSILSKEVANKSVLVLSTKDEIEHGDFPFLIGKRGDNEGHFEDDIEAPDSLMLTREMLKNAAGKDDFTAMSKEVLFTHAKDYIQEKYKVVLNEDSFKQAIDAIIAGNESAYVVASNKVSKVVYSMLAYPDDDKYDLYAEDYNLVKYVKLEKSDVITIDLKGK